MRVRTRETRLKGRCVRCDMVKFIESRGLCVSCRMWVRGREHLYPTKLEKKHSGLFCPCINPVPYQDDPDDVLQCRRCGKAVP
jgi:ribosomal protein L37E